ncbi:histidine phosphatase family protein [Streptomyces sp. MI02-7b]|uniref:histidine phosphatase family protein n=1 Tax=Streptomyces sp. MI02-7b TaxID=462941 RepID=UPI0029A1E1A7|nr:histidine phosphatase family protein [Streptomyces sp. MI02-7b]MDX3073360.1 histidine phosphatase family protein [Streptomyces sp. MI02-7b]
MTTRVTLISPVVTAALREARFDDDVPPDESALVAARAVAGDLPSAGRVLVSPSARCRATAAALGLAGTEEAPDGWALGRWRGRTLAEVSAEEPDAVAAWLSDPDAAPHDAESLRDLCARVGAWLDSLAAATGRVVAVVEPEIVRACAVRALGVPEPAFWRIDVPPLTATEFSGRSGRWNLTAGRPLA